MNQVDVIVPCYNYGCYLPECVESIITQQVNVRVLIIDDASSDETPSVAAALMAKDDRIEYRRHDVNLGHIATFNEGLDWSSSDYTLLISADDLLVENALARAVNLFEKKPDVGFVYGEIISFGLDRPRRAVNPASIDQSWGVFEGLEWLERICRLGHNILASPEVIVRTRIQKKVGGYRGELPHSADVEMWMRFALHGDVGWLSAPQAYHRTHASNISLKYRGGDPSRRDEPHIKDFEEARAAFEKFFEEQCSLIPDRDRFHRIAREGQAWWAFWSAYISFELGDSSRCQWFLDQAVKLLPTITSKPEWSNLRWKRRIGRKAWMRIKPMVSAVKPVVRAARSKPL